MKLQLNKRLDPRVSLTVAAGVAAATVMVLLGMGPRLALVVFVVVAVGAATWLAIDLGPVSAPLVWTDRGPDADRAPSADRRVRALRMRLRNPQRRRRIPMPIDTDRTDPLDEVVVTLVGIIDDHLAAEFGIDRPLDPAAAADILGPALTGFVTEPSARRSMTGRRSLARTVTLIEDLCSRTHAA